MARSTAPGERPAGPRQGAPARPGASRFGRAALVVAAGCALLAAACASLPWRWAAAVLAAGGAALAGVVLRRGRGGPVVATVAVLGLAACAVAPGGHLQVWWACAAAVAVVGHIAALNAYTTRDAHGVSLPTAAGAVGAAAVGAAVARLRSRR